MYFLALGDIYQYFYVCWIIHYVDGLLAVITDGVGALESVSLLISLFKIASVNVITFQNVITNKSFLLDSLFFKLR